MSLCWEGGGRLQKYGKKHHSLISIQYQVRSPLLRNTLGTTSESRRARQEVGGHPGPSAGHEGGLATPEGGLRRPSTSDPAASQLGCRHPGPSSEAVFAHRRILRAVHTGKAAGAGLCLPELGEAEACKQKGPFSSGAPASRPSAAPRARV